MGQRSQALWRIVAFVYGITVAALISGIVSIVALAWGVVDIFWQLLTGRNDLSEDSRPATIVTETLQWNLDLTIYAFVGKGSMQWLPSW
ncbi:hypothetical protein [Natrinema pallidum]|uniref:Uncharacterized protein n=1 Tax=Natrinema pallidum TaxID=69527 RepID=A0A4P9TJT1_9EURY|nr:hypothetical protein [Natrinema pallidum]QCW05229.1 hypothetical protein FGF80_18440 [Natrinema pallidum]